MRSRLLLGLVAVAMLSFGVSAEDGNAARKMSKREREAFRAAQKRLVEIREELRHVLPHPWAGTYVRGSAPGSLESLAVAPGSGFVRMTNDGTGFVEYSYGRVYEMGDRVVFVLDGTSVERSGTRPDSRLLVVPWGERRYLLAEDEVVEFCHAVNEGLEPAPQAAPGSLFLVREDDLKKPVTGRPGVPPEFVPYLSEPPGTQGAPSRPSPTDALSRNGKRMA